jgi:hypothetical protein
MTRVEFEARVRDVVDTLHGATGDEEHLSVERVVQIRCRFDILVSDALADAMILAFASPRDRPFSERSQ